MAKTTRILDSVVIGEEASPGTEAVSYNVTLLGDIVNCSLTVEEDERVLGGIQGGTTQGHLPSKIIDLKVTPAGSITFHPHTLKFFKYVISDYAEAAGEYTMNNRSTDLPTSLSIKGNYDLTDGVKHLGVYMTNVRPTLNDEDILTVSADLVSLFATTINETVSYTAPSGTPLIFAFSSFTFDSNEWDLQGLNLTYNPKFIQKWGIKSKTVNKRRFPSDILRGGKADIPFDGVANVQDISNELEAVWGGSNPQDVKDLSTMVLTFLDDDSKEHKIIISGKVGRTEVLQTDSEENSKTISFSGNGLDFQVSGDL